MARRVFYSFHYEPDSWRASMVRKMGALEGNQPALDNDWERVKGGGEAAIKGWIGEQLEGRTCTVVLVGAETAKRRWVLYEIMESWNREMGVVAIHIHGLKNNFEQQAARGPSPLAMIPFHTGKLSDFAQSIEPPYTTSETVYAYIKAGLANWVDAAIGIRNTYNYRISKSWRQPDNSIAVPDGPKLAHIKLESIVRSLGWSIHTNDESAQVLVANTGMSLLSWGEEVTIRTTKGVLGSNIAVSSKPKAQLIDWGKSSDNVKKVLSAIEKEMGV